MNEMEKQLVNALAEKTYLLQYIEKLKKQLATYEEAFASMEKAVNELGVKDD